MDNYKWQLQNTADATAATRARFVGRPHMYSPTTFDAAGNPLASDVGRCEHLSKCGYHKTPAQYFAENPQERERKEYRPAVPQRQKKEVRTDYIPFSLIHRSESMEKQPDALFGEILPD